VGNYLVDERDFRILSQLRGNPFASYETLGRGIGLSGKAVKTRIEALERAKILTSLEGMPAAQIFRRVPRLLFFRQPVSSLKKLEAALEINPAVFATMDVDRRAAVLIYSFSPDTIPPKELIALLGPIESEFTPLFPYPRKELSKQVTLAELKVLRALVTNLRVPVKEISKSTGVSQKVAKKIRRQLVDDGLLQVQPIFQSARSDRIILYEVHVHSNDNSVLSRMIRTLPKSVFLNQWEQAAVIFSCWADSMAEVSETERRLRNEPGVSSVRVKFHMRAILYSSRLISWIDEEISRLEKANQAS
jgi:DNA-binding Lrp family transcriptional regulator